MIFSWSFARPCIRNLSLCRRIYSIYTAFAGIRPRDASLENTRLWMERPSQSNVSKSQTCEVSLGLYLHSREVAMSRCFLGHSSLAGCLQSRIWRESTSFLVRQRGIMLP